MKGDTFRTLALLMCITTPSANKEAFRRKLDQAMDPFLEIFSYFGAFKADQSFRYKVAKLKIKVEMLARRAIELEEQIAARLKYDGRREMIMKNMEEKVIKIESMVAVRSYVDDMEGTMDIEFSFPNKDEMIKQMRDQKLQKKFLITVNLEDHMIVKDADTTASNERTKLTSINSIEKYTNFHTVKWLYYLLFCDSYYATKIRDLLAAKELSVFQLCGLVGRIHELTISNIMHYDFDRTHLNLTQIEIGLKLNGIEEEGIRSCIYVLSEIKKEKALFTGTLTTF